jgi:hypothetical protein
MASKLGILPSSETETQGDEGREGQGNSLVRDYSRDTTIHAPGSTSRSQNLPFIYRIKGTPTNEKGSGSI